MNDLIKKLDNSKTKVEKTNILTNYYLEKPKQTIKLLDSTKYINDLIPIIISKKDTTNLLEIKSVDVMKMVQDSIQTDLILTNPVLNDDIQSLLIYLITTNCENINILEETNTPKLYKIWQAIIKGHKQFKYNNVLIQVNKEINWSYNPNPNEINKIIKKKCDKTNITEKKIYLKKILDEIENPDLDEFLDYVDLYYEVCLETTEKSKNIFKRFSEMLGRNSY